jgi:hypothetical protein
MQVITMPLARTKEGQLDARSNLLQDHVGRDLENDVWYEEHRGGDIVLVSNEPELFVHALDLGISNVGSVDMREEV